MKKRFGLIIFTALLLSACGGSDGVPNLKDPSNPVDDKGNAITSTEFIKRYCVGKTEKNETCQKVLSASTAKSLRGKMPEGW